MLGRVVGMAVGIVGEEKCLLGINKRSGPTSAMVPFDRSSVDMAL